MIYEILPHLYLASYRDAQEAPDTFYVVNCTKDLPMIHEAHEGFRVPVDDNGTPESITDMAKYLPEAVAYIHQRISNGEDVIVHCQAGQQRSAAVVAAYMMRYQEHNVLSALEYVRSKKPDAFFWRANFKESLEVFAAYLRSQ